MSENDRNGILITFEGGEGVGKSTHIKILAARLAADGFDVVTLREPGGTVVSEKIRTLLLDPENAGLAPRTELLLYEAARAQLVTECILPALQRGAVVLCDRYLDSTTAYQGYGRGLDIQLVTLANRLGSLGVMPTRTVLLVDDWQLALDRARLQGADRLEAENHEFHRMVNVGFARIASEDPGRVKVVELQDDIRATASLVFAAVADLFEDDLPDEFDIPSELLEEILATMPEQPGK